MSANEYIPDPSEQKTNDKPHGKVFRLAPVESPEEEARQELLREIAPKIRRKVREDERLSAAAKFLFTAIFDDCFWRAVGGHGTGQIFADVRTLADRYGHDEKSIRVWRDELIEAGWLWTNYEWPMTEWRITPLMPAPSDNKHKKAVQMALGRAANPEGNRPDTPPSSKNGQNSTNSGHSPAGNGKTSRRSWEPIPTAEGTPPAGRGKVRPDLAGYFPTGDGIDSHGVRVTFPRATGEVPTGDGIDSHDQGESNPIPGSFEPSGQAQNASGEKAPQEKGDLSKERGGGKPPQGVSRGGEPDPEARFLASLEKLYPRELEARRAELTVKMRQAKSQRAKQALKKRIAAIEECLNGPPIPDIPDEPEPRQEPRQEEPTPEMLIEGAKYFQSIGKPIPDVLKRQMEKAGLSFQ